MYNYSRILVFMVVLALCVSVFSVSAFATEYTDETTIGDATVVEDTTVDEDITTEQLEETNTYLRYIAGFLLFIVVVILFHYAYKFFDLFF